MKTRLRFICVVILYAILTAFDNYTTYLVTPDLKWEANIAVTLFGAGWSSLIIIGVFAVATYAAFAYLPIVYYELEPVECVGFKEFYSKEFGKKQKRKLYKLVPAFVLATAAGIISRIYVITTAVLEMNGHKPCLFCALNIKHTICNCIVFNVGSRQIILPVIMIIIVAVLSIAVLLVWLKREYRMNKNNIQKDET